MKAPLVKRPKLFKIGAVLLLSTMFGQACVSPTGKLTRYASEQGLVRSTVKTEGFRLMVFDNHTSAKQKKHAREKPLAGAVEPAVLRVYLEGDGSPWRHRTIIMPDPTPRSPLMLKLMSLDTNLSVYVGRPCYNGTSSEPPCHHGLWTSGRYSQAVVQSMASAIRVLARKHKPDEVWLFGHSGGGALAMLLAPEIEQVTRVVTIAGNLDTDAWTDHHNYSRLHSSGNPANLPVLGPSIEQWHFLGARDRVIPPVLVQQAIARQISALSFIVPGFGHGCCWARIWPSILGALATDDPSKAPGNKVRPEPVSAFVVDSP